MGSVRTHISAAQHQQLTSMKMFCTAVSLVLLVLLGSIEGAPAPIILPDPVTSLAFTAAGGLVLTAASGAVVTIPTAALLLGKTLILKGALLGALSSSDEGLLGK